MRANAQAVLLLGREGGSKVKSTCETYGVDAVIKWFRHNRERIWDYLQFAAGAAWFITVGWAWWKLGFAAAIGIGLLCIMAFWLIVAGVSLPLSVVAALRDVVNDKRKSIREGAAAFLGGVILVLILLLWSAITRK